MRGAQERPSRLRQQQQRPTRLAIQEATSRQPAQARTVPLVHGTCRRVTRYGDLHTTGRSPRGARARQPAHTSHLGTLLASWTRDTLTTWRRRRFPSNALSALSLFLFSDGETPEILPGFPPLAFFQPPSVYYNNRATHRPPFNVTTTRPLYNRAAHPRSFDAASHPRSLNAASHPRSFDAGPRTHDSTQLPTSQN